MKTAEAKPAAKQAAKTEQPFFSKGGHGMLSSERVNEHGSFISAKRNPFFTNNKPIQAKLTIGSPNDKYEKEADHVADKVVQRWSKNEIIPSHINRGIQAKAAQPKPVSPVATVTPMVQAKCASCEQEEKLQKKEEENEPEAMHGKLRKKPIFDSNAEPPPDNNNSIQRTCAECEKEEKLQKRENNTAGGLVKPDLQCKPIFESNAAPEEQVQRKCASCGEEEHVQKQGDGSSAQTAAPSVENSLSTSKGSGSPLPESTRSQMESSIGADFSGVRIHNESGAAKLSKDLNAQAFTHGNDIYFNSGKYDTGSTEGKHLLAHELTHTVQQGASSSKQSSVQKTEEKIQRVPQAAGFIPAVTEKQRRYFDHKDDVVDIQGQSTFKPGNGLGNYIASLWENSQDEVAVNINFGSIASGYIFLRQSGDYVNQVCASVPLTLFGPDLSICSDIAPMSQNYYCKPHVLPLKHDAFKVNDNGTTVLKVTIADGIILCELGWVAGKKPGDIDPVMDAETVTTGEESFLPLIYGTDYDGTNYVSNHFMNQTVGGKLYFDTLGTLQLPNQQKIDGLFVINNNLFQWNGTLTGQPKGLNEYHVPVTRGKDAVLNAVSVDLVLDANWTGGNPDDERGKFTASGELRISYQNGVVSIFGKATYSSARIHGEVNIAVTPDSKAKELFAQHAPGTKTKGAATVPAAGAGTTDGDPAEVLALTAWGNLQFKLIDTKKAAAGTKGKKSPLADLEGEGAFVASSDGYIILAGQIKFPTKWLLTSELNYRSDDADDKSKHLFQHEITVAEAPVPFGTVDLDLGITVDADAHLDPLELYEIEVGGVYSNHPDYRSEVNLTPRFYIAGNAGATFTVKAELAYKLLGVFEVVGVSGSLTGTARAEAYINAAPTVKRIWPGGNTPASYAVSGIIHTGGKITFTLSGGPIEVKVAHAKVFKSGTYQIGAWTLADFGAILKMNEYIIGSGETPTFDYSRMGFGEKQRKSLANAVAKHKENKAAPDDKPVGGFTQIEDGKEKEKGTAQAAPGIPDHDADPINTELEEDFFMQGQSHELFILLGGTRKSPTALIEMASGNKKVLSEKIAEEKEILETELLMADDDKETELSIQEKDLEAIKADANKVTENAIETAQKTNNSEPNDVAGFNTLDEQLSSYGKKYNTDDIGFGANRSTPATSVPYQPSGAPKLIPGEALRVFNGKKWVHAGFEKYEKVSGTDLMFAKTNDGRLGKPVSSFNTNTGWKKYSPGVLVANYSKLDSLQRAGGVTAIVADPLVPNNGSRATPVGFISGVHVRGHLLGAQFGGSGEAKNIIPLFPHVNDPDMKKIEMQVRKAVDNLEIVNYSITPSYNGIDLIPDKISINATGDGGSSISDTIPNKP